MMTFIYNSKTKFFEYTKPYIVHRLDKETSGVLIVAKTREYAQLFTSLFRIRKIHKTYIALTHGRISKDIKTLKDDLVTIENGKKNVQKAVGWKNKLGLRINKYVFKYTIYSNL